MENQKPGGLHSSRRSATIKKRAPPRPRKRPGQGANADGAPPFQGREYDTVYPACGTGSSAVALTCAELERASEAMGWVDVTKE